MTLRQWCLLLLTAALFGSSFLFVKIAVSEVPPMTIAAARAVIAAVVISIVTRHLGTKFPSNGREWKSLILIAILTAVIPYASIAAGRTQIDSSLGGILFATIPLFSLVFAHLAFPDEPVGQSRVIGAIIGLAGVAVIIGPRAIAGLSDQLNGGGMTLIAAASYAAGAVATQKNPHVPPLTMATGQVMVAAPVLALLAVVADSPWRLIPSAGALSALVALGVVSTAAPAILFFHLVRQIGPTRTSILTFFMPVFSVLLGASILGETPGTTALAGLVLIISGAVLISGNTMRTTS